jgi:L-threonylcarbamoyladenylate synthase
MKVVQPNSNQIERAAAFLRDGRLIIVPTETVYGIAADATNTSAVQKIYRAKSRPEENPLIVHIADREWLHKLVRAWTPSAETLAERFWPGPLTLVLHKSALVPAAVTGGLDTIAVRMPGHPIALDVIRAAGVPLAMPSANRFTELSPTRIEHISPELADQVEMILDGGPCRIGVESTVVDATEEPVRILRPGGVSRSDIEAALKAPLGAVPTAAMRRSPGMYLRHYAPKAKLVMVRKLSSTQPGLTFEEAVSGQVKMPNNPIAYAANLYDAMHKIDRAGVPTIFVQLPPQGPEWEAIHDRLKKASADENKQDLST